MSERGVGGLSSHLLGRHVAGRAHDEAGFGHRMNCRSIVAAFGFRPGQFGQTEIQNFHSAVAGDKKVFRLQVTMDDALLVRRRQSARHLQAVVNCLAGGERAVPQSLAQGFAFQQLRDDVRRALLVSDVEDGKNVGMIQCRCRSRFLREALHAVTVRGKRCRQNLDGYGPIQPGIVRAIHFAHPARAEQRLDFVRS